MTLSVLLPVTITDAMLISSTAAEPSGTETAWNAATNYTLAQRAIRSTTHRIYENLIAGIDATAPESATKEYLTPARWLDYGPTNRWSMFDGEVNTQTIVTSPLTVVLQPGQFNAMYLAGIDADQLDVVVKDAPGGNVIYSASETLENSAPADYYEYFFDRFQPKTDIVISGIDPYANCEVTVTLSKPSGTVSCGILTLGDLRPLGLTQYGAKAKPKTYSYINIDDFGKNKITRRKAAKDLSATAWLDITEANDVVATLTEVLDVPCVWIADDADQYAGLRSFGLGSGEISYDYPQDCLLTIDVKGLI